MTTIVIIMAGIIIAHMGWAIVVLWKQRIAARDEAADERANAAWWRKFGKAHEKHFAELALLANDRTVGLRDIERATRNGKSGTARMVHRMAKKALDG